MEGEEACFWYFLLNWKDKILCLHTLRKRDQNQCSSPHKFHLVGWIDFKVLEKKKKRFLEGMRDLKV